MGLRTRSLVQGEDQRRKVALTRHDFGAFLRWSPRCTSGLIVLGSNASWARRTSCSLGWVVRVFRAACANGWIAENGRYFN